MLSLGEQQRLAFARLLLQRPRWIFLDEATAALDEANQDAMMTLLIEALPDAALVSIGHRPGLEAFHTRTLTLVKAEGGARFQRVAPRKVSERTRLRRLRGAGWTRRRLTLVTSRSRARRPLATCKPLATRTDVLTMCPSISTSVQLFGRPFVR